MAQLTAAQIIAQLFDKGYTPTQVANSVARSLAHVKAHNTNPVTRAVWNKAEALAKDGLAEAYVKAGPGGLPCDHRCMAAVEDVCRCACQGVNHGCSLNATMA